MVNKMLSITGSIQLDPFSPERVPERRKLVARGDDAVPRWGFMAVAVPVVYDYYNRVYPRCLPAQAPMLYRDLDPVV